MKFSIIVNLLISFVLDIALERREFFEKSRELVLTINKLSIPSYVRKTPAGQVVVAMGY